MGRLVALALAAALSVGCGSTMPRFSSDLAERRAAIDTDSTFVEAQQSGLAKTCQAEAAPAWCGEAEASADRLASLLEAGEELLAKAAATSPRDESGQKALIAQLDANREAYDDELQRLVNILGAAPTRARGGAAGQAPPRP